MNNWQTGSRSSSCDCNNKLKLNPDKTQLILIGKDQTKDSLKSSFSVSLFSKVMDPAVSQKSWCNPGIS